MELFHRETKIDFMGIRKITGFFSILLFVVSIFLLFTKGLNFALDFTGGTQLECRFSQPISLEEVRTKLSANGFPEAKLSFYGTTNDILIRLGAKAGENTTEANQAIGEKVLKALQDDKADQNNKVELRRVEFVGAEVGENLAQQGALAVIVALMATMIYIAFRFEFRFAISAAVALLHDPILILGIFAALQLEFDLATLAAILAVIGYSLNDTIVVYDRVRENFRKVRGQSTEEILNLSINQTLSRTLMTSALTLLVVLALFFFGGASLKGFSTAFTIGIVIGTYSSIYIAGALALMLGLKRQDLLPKPKEVDESP
jgi:preprotein translocase subunit SecF